MDRRTDGRIGGQTRQTNNIRRVNKGSETKGTFIVTTIVLQKVEIEM
jgi:hypothetical protein